MSISSTLTNLMNAVRSATDESNKMNVDEASMKLNNLINAISTWQHLPNITPLNSLMSTGYYYANGFELSGKPANISNTDKVRLMVLNYNHKVVQVFATPSVIWCRNYIDSAWTSWNKLGGVVKTVLFATHFHERRCAA